MERITQEKMLLILAGFTTGATWTDACQQCGYSARGAKHSLNTQHRALLPLYAAERRRRAEALRTEAATCTGPGWPAKKRRHGRRLAWAAHKEERYAAIAEGTAPAPTPDRPPGRHRAGRPLSPCTTLEFLEPLP